MITRGRRRDSRGAQGSPVPSNPSQRRRVGSPSDNDDALIEAGFTPGSFFALINEKCEFNASLAKKVHDLPCFAEIQSKFGSNEFCPASPERASFKARVQHLEEVAEFIGVDGDRFEGALLQDAPAEDEISRRGLGY